MGWIYENGNWIKKKMPYPDVIINLIGPITEKQQKVKNSLKQKCKFTSYSVGNKMRVYKKISKGEIFADYLIPTVKIENEMSILNFLDKFSKVVIKPYSGNKGRNVYFAERKHSEQIILTDSDQVKILHNSDFLPYMKTLISVEKYLIQPYIVCKTKKGLAFDFRIHVQKNGRQEWETTLIYPRISGTSKLISNINRGGYRGELLPFLLDEFGAESYKIKEQLEQFSFTFPGHFESLYKHDFDELGIDVGLDQKHKLWIFEVNCKPGSKHREFEVAKRLLPYAVSLSPSK
ncbi:YheC/YheD family protein [Mesobacillus harenae]|uniref:YheC/YheD family protein n=1 Tax=Mesobacillus harenae TaxID=2213203 RepID=UPI0015802DB9|nr:YheC/YheD family protein [Mesobacillus harenae]